MRYKMHQILMHVKMLDAHQKSMHISRMELTEERGHRLGAEIGAKLWFLMAPSYYPFDDEEDVERVATTVRLRPIQHEDIETISDLWNAMDDALGRKRQKKWKASSVIERLLAVGIDGFWEQVGGRPSSKADREAFVKQAVEQLKKKTKK
jgi:hypothetical protein